MADKPEILEFFEGGFKPVSWVEFSRLTLRELARRPFVLKALGLYFVGNGWGTDVGKIVAKRHPGKVRHIIEWLEVILPFWTSDMMDKSLIELPTININDANPSKLIEKIKRVTGVNAEVVA